jgi:hypothetical protein
MSNVSDLMAFGLPASLAQNIDDNYVSKDEAGTITAAQTFTGTVTASGTLNASGTFQVGGTTVASTAVELDSRAVAFRLADASTSGQTYIVTPFTGNIIAVRSAIGALITAGAAVLTVKDKDANAVCTVTIAASSAAGVTDSNNTISNATVTAGDMIEIETNGGSTNTAEVNGVVVIQIT